MLYWIIIGICLAEFAYTTLLFRLNNKSSHLPIPDVLVGIYTPAAYRRQQHYRRINARAGYLSTCLDTIILVSLFAFGAFALFDGWARAISPSPILQSLIFFGFVYLASWIPGIPFGIYDTFVIEERFGFNRTTPRVYIADQLKSLLLTVILGGAILSLLTWIYTLIPQWFWLLAWIAITLFSLFIQFFYSDLIVPLFNRQTPLEEGSLRDEIEKFAARVGFRISNIYVINGSKRSSHANAYFTGYGPRKRIVLYDTLIEQLDSSEIVGVLAHEIGHYRHRHLYKSMVVSMAIQLVMLYVFGLVMQNPDVAQAAGHCFPSFHINLMVFSLIYSPFSSLLSVADNYMSRYYEWQADEFAKANALGKDVASALKKMASRNMSNLTPHPWVVRLQYSHPTLKDRVIHLSE